MSKTVLIIGGNAAGLSAASQIKRLNPNWEVAVLEKTTEVSYASCGIPYFIQGIVDDPNKLFALSPQSIINSRGIDLKLESIVTKVSPQADYITVTTKDGTKNLSYDYLLIATGASPDSKDLEINSEKVFTVRYVNDGIKIKDFITKNKPQKVGVVGGGYIAVELVEALRELGLKTSLIHRRDQLNRAFEPDISQAMLDQMGNNGVELVLNTEANKIEDLKNSSKVGVYTKEGNVLEYDMLIIAIGVSPNTQFLEGSGIVLGANRTIKVSKYLQTNIKNIYAAGDVAETTDMVTGNSIFSPLALKANKEGSIAGINISREANVESFPGVLRSSILKLFDLGIARTGITKAEAEKSGFDPKIIEVESSTKPGYYPGSKKIKTYIVFDLKFGKLLGAQMIGPLSDVKRIDTIASQIQAGKTIDDLYQLDLAYAPPFSPVYDPVVLTGRVGKKLLK